MPLLLAPLAEVPAAPGAGGGERSVCPGVCPGSVTKRAPASPRARLARIAPGAEPGSWAGSEAARSLRGTGGVWVPLSEPGAQDPLPAASCPCPPVPGAVLPPRCCPALPGPQVLVGGGRKRPGEMLPISRQTLPLAALIGSGLRTLCAEMAITDPRLRAAQLSPRRAEDGGRTQPASVSAALCPRARGARVGPAPGLCPSVWGWRELACCCPPGGFRGDGEATGTSRGNSRDPESPACARPLSATRGSASGTRDGAESVPSGPRGGTRREWTLFSGCSLAPVGTGLGARTRAGRRGGVPGGAAPRGSRRNLGDAPRGREQGG